MFLGGFARGYGAFAVFGFLAEALVEVAVLFELEEAGRNSGA